MGRGNQVYEPWKASVASHVDRLCFSMVGIIKFDYRTDGVTATEPTLDEEDRRDLFESGLDVDCPDPATFRCRSSTDV